MFIRHSLFTVLHGNENEGNCYVNNNEELTYWDSLLTMEHTGSQTTNRYKNLHSSYLQAICYAAKCTERIHSESRDRTTSSLAPCCHG